MIPLHSWKTNVSRSKVRSVKGHEAKKSCIFYLKNSELIRMGDLLHCHGGETNLPSVKNRVSFAANCYTVFLSCLLSVFDHKCTNFLQFPFVPEVKKRLERDMSSIQVSPFLKKEKQSYT